MPAGKRCQLRSVARNLVDFKLLSRFLAEHCPDRQHDPAVLDRPLLEAFIGWLARRGVEKKGPYYGQPIRPNNPSRTPATLPTPPDPVPPPPAEPPPPP